MGCVGALALAALVRGRGCVSACVRGLRGRVRDRVRGCVWGPSDRACGGAAWVRAPWWCVPVCVVGCGPVW
eukprot:4279285-Alexandrium_andersonii.AAC.1